MYKPSIYAAKPLIKGIFRIRLSNIENPYAKFTHVKSDRCQKFK